MASSASVDEAFGTNPLLQDFDFPPFDVVDAKHVRPGIRALLKKLVSYLSFWDFMIFFVFLYFGYLFCIGFWVLRVFSNWDLVFSGFGFDGFHGGV